MADAPLAASKPRRKPAASARKPSKAVLAEGLVGRFADSLLPSEAEGMNARRLTEAARFTLTAMAEREPGEPGIALESVGGRTGERYLRVAVVNDDMPFLVDSIAAAVAEQGLTIERLLHPVVPVQRDAKGRLTAILAENGADESRESVIYFETERGDARQRRALASLLTSVLGDVHAAVADWPKLQEAMLSDAERIDAQGGETDGAALLRWLNDGMLTQLGHVTRRRDGSQHGLLGICRKSARALLAPASYERAFAWFEARGKGRRAADRQGQPHLQRPPPRSARLVHRAGDRARQGRGAFGPCRGLDQRGAGRTARSHPAAPQPPV